MFLDAHGIVAAAIERIRVQPAEITNTRQSDVHQAVEEFIHALLAQRHLDAQRHVFTHLEAGDRLAGMGDDGLLAGDLFEIGRSGLDLLGVVDGFANAHVQHDLVELWQLHDILVAELLGQSLADVLVVLDPKARKVSCISHRSRLRSTWRRAI